jgi:hypothetical protein
VVSGVSNDDDPRVDPIDCVVTDIQTLRLSESSNRAVTILVSILRWTLPCDGRGYSVRGHHTDRIIFGIRHKNISEFIDNDSLGDVKARGIRITIFEPWRADCSS